MVRTSPIYGLTVRIESLTGTSEAPRTSKTYGRKHTRGRHGPPLPTWTLRPRSVRRGVPRRDRRRPTLARRTHGQWAVGEAEHGSRPSSETPCAPIQGRSGPMFAAPGRSRKVVAPPPGGRGGGRCLPGVVVTTSSKARRWADNPRRPPVSLTATDRSITPSSTFASTLPGKTLSRPVRSLIRPLILGM